MPGNRRNMLEKALELRPDVFIPDMEDSVTDREKTNARDMVASFLPKLAKVGPIVIPRINPMDSGFMEEDLKAVMSPYTFAVSVGKVDSAGDLSKISCLVNEKEKEAKLKEGSVKLIVWIETAMAVVNAYDICVASPRIVAVAFGAEDFTNDLGIERTDDDTEIAYPRSVVGVAAKAAGVLALDTPYFKFHDTVGLERNARLAKGYGFTGKFAIHPAQINIINKVFVPSQREIDHAYRVVQVFEEAEKMGKGSTSLDGKVIDVPVVKRARKTLELARSSSALEHRRSEIVD